MDQQAVQLLVERLLLARRAEANIGMASLHDRDRNLKVHFIHEKARVRKEKAIPLLLVHGWPGTFFEYVSWPQDEILAHNNQASECNASFAQAVRT
jgi:hypothetical protein